MDDRKATARWPRWAAYAAGAWSLVYGGLGLYWALGGTGFPFGEGDIPDARAESLLGGATAAGTAPVIAALGFAGAVLALVIARVRLRGAARVAVLATAWLAAWTLVALIPDGRIMIAVGYAPIFLVGLPFGWPDVDYFEVALPWPVLNLIICLGGGLLWTGAALAFQRRTSDSCGGCGRSERRTATWTAPASAARWGRWAAYTAFAIPLFYAVVRWAWALDIPLLFSKEDLRWLHESGLVWAGAGLATVAAAGSVLTLGLVHRWGEAWAPLDDRPGGQAGAARPSDHPRVGGHRRAAVGGHAGRPHDGLDRPGRLVEQPDGVLADLGHGARRGDAGLLPAQAGQVPLLRAGLTVEPGCDIVERRRTRPGSPRRYSATSPWNPERTGSPRPGRPDQPPRRPARAESQAKSSGVNSLGSTSTSQLPELSRMTASTPYGRSDGSCRKVTPLALSSSIGLAAVVDPQAEAAHLALLELAPDEVGGVGVERRPGRHQGDLELGLAGVADGDPAKALAHGDVGAGLEAQDST